MSDPFSIFAAAAGLADVSIRTSSRLLSLISEFKNAPALILALSNETAEISVVLERINESRQAVESLGDAQHDAAFLAGLDSQLNNARVILTDLETLAARLSAGKPANKGFRWLRQKKHATTLQRRLKEVRENMNELLVAHNPSLESRVRLELREVRVGMQQAQSSAQVAVQNANSNFQATSGELLNIRTTMAHHQAMTNSDIRAIQHSMSAQAVEAASHKQEVNDQLSAIHNTIYTGSQAVSRLQAEQTRQFEATQAVQMAILTELAALSNSSVVPRRTAPMVQPAPPHDNSVIFFSMRLRGSHCGDGCRCRCHMPARPSMLLTIPPMLRAVVGYLFLSYTGYPSASAGCNMGSCARGKYMRLQVTYGFPFSWCLRYVMYAWVEASTSGIFTFAIVARRRIPYEPGTIIYESTWGSANIVRDLLQHEKGCFQDVYQVDGRSALQLTISAKKIPTPERIEIMKLLLQHGADPDYEDDFGMSPRRAASQAIFSKSNSPDYTRASEDLFPLSSCIEALELSYMHKIVLGLLPISLESALQKPGVEGLNAKDISGRTPLMWAARRGNVTDVAALIEAGADVNEADLRGYTALHNVVMSRLEGGLISIEALLRAGADVNAVTQDGFSCMLLAAEYNQVAIGDRLIDAGADIHSPSAVNGLTPMSRAALYNSMDMIRCLYDAGASLEPTNRYGETPLFTATQTGATEALALLLRLGANTAHVDSQMRTLLHHVVSYASLESMRTLADIGVKSQDARARDKDGLTAQQLLDKRQPGSEMRAAFARLVQAWCSAPEGADKNVNAEEDCFYDAVEYLGGGDQST